MGCCRALNAEVGISPGGGVKASQVIAADKADGAIHNQQFAMIEGVVAEGKNVPPPPRIPGMDPWPLPLHNPKNTLLTQIFQTHLNPTVPLTPPRFASH